MGLTKQKNTPQQRRVFCLFMVVSLPPMEVDHFASGADCTALGDLAGLLQSLAGQRRAYQLIDQHREQGDVGHNGAFCTQRFRLHGHTQRYTGLWEQRNTQIFDDAGTAAHRTGAERRTLVFAQTACSDIQQADHDNVDIPEHRQFQFRTTEDEEQHVQRGRPAVHTGHQFQ